MDFDPDAYLAGKPQPAAQPKRAKPTKFDPDAWLAANAPAPEPPPVTPAPSAPMPAPVVTPPTSKPPEEPGQGEAALRGLQKGATFGFSDRLAGLGGYIGDRLASAVHGLEPNPNAAAESRAETAAAEDAAQKAWPKTSFGTQVAGGIPASIAAAPLFGAAAPAITEGGGAIAEFGARALQPVVEGAVSGVGNTKSDDIGDLAEGAALGAAGGVAGTGATAALGKVGRATQKYVSERPTEKLLEGIPTKAQNEAFERFGGGAAGKAELARMVVNDPKLLKAAKKGAAALDAEAEAQAGELGKKIGTIYKAADANGKDLPVADVLATLGKLKDQYRIAGDTPKFKAVDAEIQGLKELWGKHATIGAENVHGVVQRFGNKGFGGNLLNPSQQAEISRDLHAATRDMLQDYVEKKTGQAGELRAMNNQFSKLRAVQELAEVKGQKDAAGARTFGQKLVSFGQKGAITGGALLSATGNMNPLPLVLGTALAATPPTARMAASVIAATSKFLEGGGSKREALREMLANGIPRGAALATVAKFGPNNPD